ncbi:MAG: cobalamin biosynthesis protein [Paracoccaceae bacterium]|nr:cobalamin biosynthesis protein [Paracoccaceae bacterium]MDG2259664.1 cobalamin biosynthesis protein [Paracoccaceae bacterium]
MKIAGIGLRKAATIESLRSALTKVDSTGVSAIATPIDKADFSAIQTLAHELGLNIIGVESGDLIAQTTATQSERVQNLRGTGSVAEAAALAGAGKNARLLIPRVVSDDRMATCAIAEGNEN